MAETPPPFDSKPAAGPADGLLQKLRELPRPAQVALGVVLFGVFYLVVGGNHGGTHSGNNPNVTSAAALSAGGDVSGSQVFSGIESDRPVLMQGWLEQNRREMTDLKQQMQAKFDEKDKALNDALQNNAEMQSQMRQMMTDFTAEIKNIQDTSAKDREALSALTEQQHQQQLNAPVDNTGGVVMPANHLQKRIEQKPLGGGGAAAQVQGQPFLAPLGNAVHSLSERSRYTDDGYATAERYAMADDHKLPFMPPLGFVRGTLLNGVDALVGGQATPSLVRLNGTYKTAMGTTVMLDGCYALVEFQGEVSTERAVGKPARMTCVYPDQGAVTYSLSGYVVDAEDGIIGIPGVFYEGDASRIAAAMLADFAAGVAGVVKDNQSTVTVDSTGNATQSITGNQLKGEVAGGVEKAVSSLRDYLLQRVNRVLPFVRLDATRQLDLVLLSGTELRAEGSAWSLLFDAEAADQARANAANNTGGNASVKTQNNNGGGQ